MRRLMAGVASMSLMMGLPSAEAQAQEDNNPCDDPIIGAMLDGVAIATGYESCEDMYGLPEDGEPISPEVPPASVYVALGDSVAAGQGLAPVELPVGDDLVCARSTQAYPEIVAERLNIPLANVACKGATAGDLVTEQHLSGTFYDIEPQLDQAFANGTPELMTITAGANDVYWTYFARRCYRTECGGPFDTITARSLTRVLQLKLDVALTAIDELSDHQPPKVFLTGYYNPISAACANLDPNITPAEIGWFSSQLAGLNASIRQAANGYDFAEFVPLSFKGHDICSSDPWVQGIGDKAPFHPNVEGQQAIAERIIQAA